MEFGPSTNVVWKCALPAGNSSPCIVGTRIFLTAYLEDDVPDVGINPPDYREASSSPLHRVRLNRGFFESLLSKHGLAMVRFDHACEHDGQSGVYLGAAT